MANEDLIIRIGAKADKFKDELDSIQRKTKNLSAGMTSLAKVSGAAFLGIAGSIGLTVKQFADFDNGIRGVKTLLNESSFGAKGLEKGFEELRNEALKLAKDAPVAIDTLNKALFDTVSAGIDAGKAVDVVRIASELAVAGLTDVSVATDGITSALNAYGLSAEDAEAVAAKFFQAQVSGKTTIEELSSNFGKAGATASAYGVSLDELLSSVSAVTAGGVKTQSAFTGLNALMVNISKPTAEAAAEAKKLGIEFNSTALRAQGLEGFLNTLTEAEGFTQESIEKLFGSVEAQKVAFALTGAQAELFGKTLNKLGDETQAAATFQEAYATQSASVTNQMKKLTNGITVLSITIGSKLAPTIGSLTELLQNATDNLNAMDESQKEGIATFLKWGAIITGGTTAILAFGAVVLKISALIGALTLAFAPATLGASAFWVALTGPIGIAIAGIAAVVAGGIALFKVFSRPEPPKGLEDVNAEIAKLRKQETELEKTAVTNRLGQQNRSAQRLEDIRNEIAELEKLRNAKISDDNKNEDGSLLIRPKVDESFSDKIGQEIFGDKPIEAPFSLVVKDEVDTSPVDAKIDEVTQKRIQAQKDELEINKAISNEKVAEEIEFLKRRQALREEQAEIDLIQNETEKNLAIENLRLKNEALKNEEAEHFQKKQELKLEQREQEKVLEEELQALSEEERAALTEKDLEQLRESAATKQQINRDAAKVRIAEQRKANKQFLDDQAKHGKAFALINQIMHSEILKGSARAFGELEQLQRSSNSTLKSIGKAAAIANIIIKTAQSAINIYTGFSTIPIIGPALGIAGAAAAVAFGAEQVGKVRSAQSGGLVTAGIKGVDNQPFLLGRGEIVAPDKSFDEVVEGTARQRGFTKAGEAGGAEVATLLREISEKLNGGIGDFNFNGDILADEVFIDKMVESIREAIEFRNASLET